jgi:mRNA-degrading endonuclease YafQ of YafQ-DinJ toxin-antitoxin module
VHELIEILKVIKSQKQEIGIKEILEKFQKLPLNVKSHLLYGDWRRPRSSVGHKLRW